MKKYTLEELKNKKTDTPLIKTSSLNKKIPGGITISTYGDTYISITAADEPYGYAILTVLYKGDDTSNPKHAEKARDILEKETGLPWIKDTKFGHTNIWFNPEGCKRGMVKDPKTHKCRDVTQTDPLRYTPKQIENIGPHENIPFIGIEDKLTDRKNEYVKAPGPIPHTLAFLNTKTAKKYIKERLLKKRGKND